MPTFFLIHVLAVVLLLPWVANAQPGPKINWGSRVASDPPLTRAERWKLIVRNDFSSPGAFFRTVGPSLSQQIRNRPVEWERTGEGFGRRLGMNFATITVQDVVQSGTAALIGHDPRYQRCDCKGGARRVRQAFTGLVLGADRHGVRRFDPSNLISAYVAGYVGASLYPDAYSRPVKGAQLGHFQVGQVVIGNLFTEFGPDLKRLWREKILRRKQSLFLARNGVG